MRAGLIVIGLGAIALASCVREPPAPYVAPPAPLPHPNSINGQMSRPWHHVGAPVSAQRQAEDEAKCKVIANLAPEADEIKYYVTYINCLKAAGYEPDPPNAE